MTELTQEVLKELLEYDPSSGNMFWKKRVMVSTKEQTRWNNRYSGKLAGSIDSSGKYMNITIHYRAYKLHRVIWLHLYGEIPEEIDHIDGNGLNNKIENLRNVNCATNCKNRPLRSDNYSMVNGVRFREDLNKWLGDMRVNGKYIYLGIFSDFFDAVCARKSAELKHGFHLNHGRIV